MQNNVKTRKTMKRYKCVLIYCVEMVLCAVHGGLICLVIGFLMILDDTKNRGLKGLKIPSIIFFL